MEASEGEYMEQILIMMMMMMMLPSHDIDNSDAEYDDNDGHSDDNDLLDKVSMHHYSIDLI
jgi:hypothetical protein